MKHLCLASTCKAAKSSVVNDLDNLSSITIYHLLSDHYQNLGAPTEEIPPNLGGFFINN